MTPPPRHVRRKILAGVVGGAYKRVKRAQTREQGPPSAPAEILDIAIKCHTNLFLPKNSNINSHFEATPCSSNFTEIYRIFTQGILIASSDDL